AAAEGSKALHEVVDLIRRERQAELVIGALERPAAPLWLERDATQGPGWRVIEQPLRVLGIKQHHFGHAVEQHGSQGGQLLRAERTRVQDPIFDPALDSAD